MPWKEVGKVNKDTQEGLYMTFKPVMMIEAQEAVRTLLKYIGEDPDREGLKDTPKRVVNALREMAVTDEEEPSTLLKVVFEDSYDEVVILRGIPFTSTCEHHLLPFHGTVDIGYIPSRRGVVGLSKLARLVNYFSHRLQLQERLTRQIADSIQVHLEAEGVAVVVRASHSCISCRGVCKSGTEMLTSCMLGSFREDSAARAEFLNLSS